MYLLDWESAVGRGPQAAGGKGYNLGRLQQFGFKVPVGVVIDVAAYWDFSALNGLSDEMAALAALSGDAVAGGSAGARLAALRARIEAGSLPAGLLDELTAWLAAGGLQRAGLAVRSSATAEDSAAASFAGIHRSFLNVTGTEALAAAVKGCYASLWTPVAVAYRRRMGFSDTEVGCAVVVQQLVQALAAGVVFSADPRTGRRDRVVINAAYGLGESVVQGNVEVDEFVLQVTNYSMVKLVGGRIGLKHRAIRPAIGGGTRTEELGVGGSPGGSGRSDPAITKEQQQRLALIALRIQDALGESTVPQDIEWAFDGWGFTVLQSRPITALPEATFPALAGQKTIWSTANLKDALPGVQSPLGWWLNSAWAEVMLRDLFTAAGYPLPEGLTWSRLYSGRAFLNLSAVQWAAYDAFGIPPAQTNRSLGGHQPEVTLPPPPSHLSAPGRARLRRLLRFGRRLRRATRRAAVALPQVTQWAEAQAHLPKDRGRLHDLELLRSLWRIELERRRFLPDQMVYNAGGLWSDRLKALLDGHLPGRGAALTNALLAGGGGITSAEQGWRLAAIARQAARETEALAFFAAEPFAPAQWFAALRGTQTRELLKQFLGDFGHRGVYEMEIANPRWGEDPSFILNTLRSYLQDGVPHTEAEAVERRREAEATVFAQLRWRPLAAAYCRYLIARSREAMRLREAAKSVLVRLIGAMRPWCLELGRRLVARKLIAQVDDVFFLTGNDLVALAIQDWDGTGLGPLIAHRRARRAVLLAETVPEVVFGDEPAPRAPLPEVAGKALVGVGVSAGRAAGQARLIAHPDEGGRLAVGEVLVAPSTDPAWTPLFLRACALVTEVGGYLSHGAIVAREYGIPAVVNIPGIRAVLHDGETVTVDGDAGKVYRQEE